MNIDHDTDMKRTNLLWRVIDAAMIEDNVLVLKMRDGATVNIYDEAQHCCEYRYMTCDDDVSVLNNSALLSIDLEDISSGTDDGCDDQRFLKIQSTTGNITICNHNEHNGYYGGFELKITEERP